VPAPFIPGRHPIRREGTEIKRISSNPEPQLLPMNAASSGAFGETHRPAPGHFRGFLLVPNSCVHGCIRPTGRGNGASNIAVWSRECDRLPILPLPVRRQSSVATPMAADLQPGRCINQDVKRGKHCDSASFLVNLIYKRSD